MGQTRVSWRQWLTLTFNRTIIMALIPLVSQGSRQPSDVIVQHPPGLG
jgi:hypothetical protein